MRTKPPPMTVRQKHLAAKWYRLACKVANNRKRNLPAKLHEEVESAAFFGLAAAARTFDGRGTFEEYACWKMTNAIKDALREAQPIGFRRQRGGPTVSGFADDGEYLVRSGEGPVGWEVEGADGVEALCRRLPRRQARVMRMLYGQAGMDGVKVAKRLGVSEAHVSQLRTRALAKLRRQLVEEGYGAGEGAGVRGGG